MTPEEIAAKEAALAAKEAELKAKEQELTEREAELKKKLEESTDEEKVNLLVKAKVDEKLKDIKTKLDNAYTTRDAALKEASDLKQEKREAEIKKLQEEGKHKEAAELEKATLKAEKETLEKRVIELTRDNNVKDAIAAYTFKTAKAKELAISTIIDELKVGEDGVWAHKSGISLSEYVTKFAEDEDNEFLFKSKANNGSGHHKVDGKEEKDKKKTSIFDEKQEDVVLRVAKRLGKVK